METMCVLFIVDTYAAYQSQSSLKRIECWLVGGGIEATQNYSQMGCFSVPSLLTSYCLCMYLPEKYLTLSTDGSPGIFAPPIYSTKWKVPSELPRSATFHSPSNPQAEQGGHSSLLFKKTFPFHLPILSLNIDSIGVKSIGRSVDSGKGFITSTNLKHRM